MKNNYIELIEKTAMPSNLLYEKTVRSPLKGNRSPRTGEIENFKPGTEVDSEMRYNLENIFNNKDNSFNISSSGIDEEFDELSGETSFKDIAREVAIKNNQESRYDEALNKIKSSIRKRNKLSNAAISASALGGVALGGTAGFKLGKALKSSKGSLALGGSLAGLGASGLLAGLPIAKNTNNKNKQEYLNALTEEQRDSIKSKFNDYSERAARNINIHDTVGYDL